MSRVIGKLVQVTLAVFFSAVAVADLPTEEDAQITDWTFDQAENVACFTLRQIIDDGAPILFVVHDEHDHGWQFLTGDEVTMDDARILSMREIVDHDRTVLEIGHMRPGYRAKRVAVGEPWEISRIDE